MGNIFKERVYAFLLAQGIVDMAKKIQEVKIDL